MKINKDTKIYCSFSENPGNNGCIFFNKKFKKNNINAIYKSFYSNNLLHSINAVKALNFSGFALSMPFKIDVLNYANKINQEVKRIGSSNTIINDNGKLIAYNTDWLGVLRFFEEIKMYDEIAIAGNGGFSKAIQYACKELSIKFEVISRINWGRFESLNVPVFNATPIDLTYSGEIIDGRPNTKTGKTIAMFQAEEQYKLYIKWM